MKKNIALIAAALLALTGCTSHQVNNSSVTSDAQISAVGSAEPAAGISPDNSSISIAEQYETEIAWETQETPDEPRREPPQLQVIYSGDGLANCAAMTLGTYSWDTGSGVICADSIGPVACAAAGHISAVVDLDTVAQGEPKINLWGGAEITGASLYPLDNSEAFGLEVTQDAVILFPEDVTGGVVCVYTKFPEGEAVYYFMVKRTLTDPQTPPQLRVFPGEIGFSMTKGAYEWTYTEGDETATEITDIDTPWNLYKGGHIKPDLFVLPGEKLTIMLPEGGEIISAQCWTADDSSQTLDYSGREITMPQENISGVCCITVKMTGGVCDYLFSVNVGEIASSPAYDPEEAKES